MIIDLMIKIQQYKTHKRYHRRKSNDLEFGYDSLDITL